MKLTRYAIVFILIFMSMFGTLSYRVNKFTTSVTQKAAINDAIDTAVDAAVNGIVETADGDSVTISQQNCISNFYRSLYASFGIIDSTVQQQLLLNYIPVMAIVDEEGLYVNYSDNSSNSRTNLTKVWSHCIPYSESYTAALGPGENVNFCVNFTLTDFVTISIDYDGTSGISSGEYHVYSGDWQDLKAQYGTDNAPAGIKAVFTDSKIFSAEEGVFETVRNNVVTDTIVNRLNYYVNQHNRIAKLYGEQYTFHLPSTAYSDVNRNLDNISFICFFEGYPIGKGTDNTYSKFSIGAARVIKNIGYFTRLGDDGLLYYHKDSCNNGIGKTYRYVTREECALQGAMPCPVCNP